MMMMVVVMMMLMIGAHSLHWPQRTQNTDVFIPFPRLKKTLPRGILCVNTFIVLVLAQVGGQRTKPSYMSVQLV